MKKVKEEVRGSERMSLRYFFAHFAQKEKPDLVVCDMITIACWDVSEKYDIPMVYFGAVAMLMFDPGWGYPSGCPSTPHSLFSLHSSFFSVSRNCQPTSLLFFSSKLFLGTIMLIFLI